MYRRAYLLILTMNAAQPAAWSTHPFLEFTESPFDVLTSGLVFLYRGNPAYPLIAREGRKTLPYW